MIHSTKGIVLRVIKYGETSVVTSVFTELFGIQSYLVNGVRTQAKSSKAHFFQPSSLLEIQVYHNELKNLQRIKEVRWSFIYKNIFNDVIKNCVALYMTELLQKTLKQPEVNEDLFHFCEDTFIQLDTATAEVTANLAIYFTIQLSHFLGLKVQDNYSERNKFFNINEGIFTNEFMENEYSLNEDMSYHFSQLLKVIHPDELKQIKLNKIIRKTILSSLEKYFMFHLSEFTAMKTLPILHELMA